MASSPNDAPKVPLTRSQADDVLRYWLAAVRLEEALKVRPRARRVQHGESAPRIDTPSPGQEYFKLPLDSAVAPLLLGQEPLQRPLDGELSAFFEAWLHLQYRRGQDDDEPAHLLCFPVVHLPKGELAGLLRAPVRLRFAASDGKLFRAPSRSERQQGRFPAAPNEARISKAPRAQGSWPFFIDTRLLSHPLGLSSEEIDALFDALRSHDELSEAEMIALVTRALESAAREQSEIPVAETTADAANDSPLARLKSAMQLLLQRQHARAEVYPVGIVIDGTEAKTTWHLQRELLQLTEPRGDESWQQASCLGAYLTQQPRKVGEQFQRALFAAPALTPQQRRVAETFWGSELTSVQGPPGTGKTTLILHLCAEALVRQVDNLLDKKVMGTDLLLITSSNNRAVDNVVDPLMAVDGLPLALRVGSRQICEQSLSIQLRRVAAWLKHAQVEPQNVRALRLEQALSQFADTRARLDKQLAPRKSAQEDSRKRAQLESALSALRSKSASAVRSPKESPFAALSEESAFLLDPLLSKLERRLETLSELCSGKPSMAQVNAIARHYEQTASRDLPPFEAALTQSKLSIDVPLPPLATPLEVSLLLEAWEEGAELFLHRLSTLREQVDRVLQSKRRKLEVQNLSAQLAALDPPPSTLPELADHDELSRELFQDARRVREAWAQANANKLHDVVTAAAEAVTQERSLRALFRDAPDHATLLCGLFGVWGSTLLSLGNCVPAELQSVARVVIDEAGQCHPAHAVSALLRARSAMILGDVHQLEPVIDLRPEDEARLVRTSGFKAQPERLAPFRLHSDNHLSAQALAEQAVPNRQKLIDHFRCQPEIIAISDALCNYELKVHTAKVDTTRKTLLTHPVSMMSVRGEQERLAGSLWNELELRETLKLVQQLLARGVTPPEIALITPYRGQLECLRRALLDLRIPLEQSAELMDSEGSSFGNARGVALGTVHRFQGGERSVVLFSSVVTRASSLPFLNARPNLLNVAVSRAQHHFVCIGDADNLARGVMTRRLVHAARPLAWS